MAQFRGKEVVVFAWKAGIITHLYADGTVANKKRYKTTQPYNISSQMFWLSRHYFLQPNQWITAHNLEYSCGFRYKAAFPFLEGLFLWDGPYCMSWDDTMVRFKRIGLQVPEVLYKGEYYEPFLESEFSRKMARTSLRGFVIRDTAEFPMYDFYRCVAQSTRPYRKGTSEEYYMQNLRFSDRIFPKECPLSEQDSLVYHDLLCALSQVTPEDKKARRRIELELNKLEDKYGLYNCLRTIGR